VPEFWEKLGYVSNPYSTEPLAANQLGADLFVGRARATASILATLGAASEGVQILSGAPGVGKTSFFNVTQYKVETNLASAGPKLLGCCEQLCQVSEQDDLRELSRGVLETLCTNIIAYCLREGHPLPEGIRNLSNWLKNKGTTSYTANVRVGIPGVISVGIGGGQKREYPPVADASFQTLQEVAGLLAQNVVEHLPFDGLLVGLDNMEEYRDLEKLKSLLMTLRDTLFSVPRIWWVLIGQERLYPLISRLDRRVADRIQGAGTEITHLSLRELEQAIERRVLVLSEGRRPQAPLPSSVHQLLYEKTGGQCRATLQYCSQICIAAYTGILEEVETKEIGQKQKTIGDELAKMFLSGQMATDVALSLLRDVVAGRIELLDLSAEETHVLQMLEPVQERTVEELTADVPPTALTTMEEMLRKLCQKQLLDSRLGGDKTYFVLSGEGALARSLDLI